MTLKIALLVGLIVVAGILVFSLIRRHHSSSSRISLDDLLLGEDGRVSKAAAVMLGAFAMTTWVIVYLALTGKLTEGYFSAYLAAWVAPTVTRLIVARNPPTGVQTSAEGAQR